MRTRWDVLESGQMKKPIQKILLLLISGALTNIAVAWGCAFWIMIAPSNGKWQDYQWPSGAYHTGISVYSGAGRTVICCYYGPPYDAASPIRPSPEPFPDNSMPVWSCAYRAAETKRTLLAGREAMKLIVVDVGQGWPCLAMCHRYMIDRTQLTANDGKVEVLSGLEVETRVDGIWPDPRILPLRPIWPGFAVNSIFYSAGLWLVIFGPLAVRGSVRRRRRLCVRCGYDLRGAAHVVCPECGARPTVTSGCTPTIRKALRDSAHCTVGNHHSQSNWA